VIFAGFKRTDAHDQIALIFQRRLSFAKTEFNRPKFNASLGSLRLVLPPKTMQLIARFVRDTNHEVEGRQCLDVCLKARPRSGIQQRQPQRRGIMKNRHAARSAFRNQAWQEPHPAIAKQVRDQ
jgi:hypothetical protein